MFLQGYMMRRVAVDLNIPFISTIAGAKEVRSLGQWKNLSLF